jgi:hypothetical protein
LVLGVDDIDHTALVDDDPLRSIEGRIARRSAIAAVSAFTGARDSVPDGLVFTKIEPPHTMAFAQGEPKGIVLNTESSRS